MYISPNIAPYPWTELEAFRSGRMAYRIKVEFSGNPFKNNLGKSWENGWKDAAMKDTTSIRRPSSASYEKPNRRPRMFDKDEQLDRQQARRKPVQRRKPRLENGESRWGM